MKLRLVNALRKDGSPLYVDGERQGRSYPFIDRDDMIVVRTPTKMSAFQAQRLSDMLRRSLHVYVLIVDNNIEFLKMETRFEAALRVAYLRLIAPWTRPLVALAGRASYAIRLVIAKAKAKFAIRALKS